MGYSKVDTRLGVSPKEDSNQEVIAAYACQPSYVEDWGRRIEILSLAYRVYAWATEQVQGQPRRLRPQSLKLVS